MWSLKLELQYLMSISDPDAELAPQRSASPKERLRALVADILDSRYPSKPLSDDDTLAEIGIASIDMVKLLLLVESEFNVEVPSHEITADVFRSISTIDALLQRLTPPCSAPDGGALAGRPSADARAQACNMSVGHA